MNQPSLMELVCEACSWRCACGPEDIDRRLRSAGMLKREKSPDRATMLELLTGAAPRMPCPECKTAGLRLERMSDDGSWQDAVVCEVCRRPIPAERLEAVPDAVRCVACQNDAERGRLAEEPEYCPKCGSPMVLRVSRGVGIARYKMFCTGVPPCR